MEPVFPNTPEARARREAALAGDAARNTASPTLGGALDAMRDRGELTLLDVAEARDEAWRLINDILTGGEPAAATPGEVAFSLDHAVSAWRTLRDAAAEDTGTVADLREAGRRATADLAAADARINDLEGMAVRVVKAAKDAGGPDAFTGRYEVLGAELVNLDSLVDQ